MCQTLALLSDLSNVVNALVFRYEIRDTRYEMKSKSMLTRLIETPLGVLEIALDNSDLNKPFYRYFEFKQKDELLDLNNSSHHELLDLAATQFNEYFSGQRKTFSDLVPFFHSLGTDFQKQVWHALLDIPYGETCSYSDLANLLDNPKAVRAVGAANGKNPLAIVVPCHRVIGSNGTLTGYAGGLDKKQWLLEFENPQSKLSF